MARGARLGRIGALAGLAAAAAASTAGMTETNPVQASSLPPARDGNIAIQEELCAARQAGTRAAYDLFIARHPDHPLATVAREERARLQPEPRAPRS